MIARIGAAMQEEVGTDAPTGVVALAPRLLWRPIAAALDGLRLRFEFAATPGAFADRIEAAYPDILLMDLDLAARPDELVRFARSLRTQTRVIAATTWWSDRLPVAEVDLTLHKPPRRDEWFPAMARLLASMR